MLPPDFTELSIGSSMTKVLLNTSLCIETVSIRGQIGCAIIICG